MLKTFALLVAFVSFLGLPGLAAGQATPEAEDDPEFFSALDGYVGGGSSNLTPLNRSLAGVINIGSGMAQFEDEASAKAAWKIFNDTFLEYLADQDETVDVSGLQALEEPFDFGDETTAWGGKIKIGEDEASIDFDVTMIFARQGTVIFGIQAVAGGTDPTSKVSELMTMIVERNPQPAPVPVDASSEDSPLWGWLLTPADEVEGFVVDNLEWRDAEGTRFEALEPTDN